MSRITAHTAKFARAMSLNAATAARPMVADSHHATAGLMPKYAELLNGRSTEDHSRGILTTHGPRYKLPTKRPLMQTFTASASTASVAASGPRHIDAAMMPAITPTSAVSDDGISVPLINGQDQHATSKLIEAEAAESDAATDRVVVAADPSVVSPSTPLTSVHSMGPDNVELKFSHQDPQSLHKGSYNAGDSEGGMFRDIWKGIVDDVSSTVNLK
ncbi:hypothetical protein CFIMG_006897RA [Ceratocystis fimbriata CBS 114723]|uniref:Uncharacterized protein n=1 Tax=Ceratocystis fimbriata CBS 114723 TaxID=1035309 RepID=A0A2C5WUZ7_9PEZI|nr:hypothetical protein CFIMG_006897RA [Ceratocystis fimbriata CBS 114723]